MENRQWAIDNRQQKIENEHRTMDNRQWAIDNKQRTIKQPINPHDKWPTNSPVTALLTTLLTITSATFHRWQVSRPDGSQLEAGTGDMPRSLVDAHRLDSVLAPQQMSTTWAVLAADGTVLETGIGPCY